VQHDEVERASEVQLRLLLLIKTLVVVLRVLVLPAVAHLRVVAQDERQKKFFELLTVWVLFVEQRAGVWVVEMLVEVDCVRQVIKLSPVVLIVGLGARSPLNFFVAYALVFLLDTVIFLALIVKDGVFDFESGDETGVVPEKGRFGAHHGVDLAHGLHDLEFIVVQLGRHEVDVPHREVGMEENDGLHGQLGQIGVVLHEIAVERRERLHRIRKLPV